MIRIPGKHTVKERIISPVREFISDSRAAGIVLLCCTAISLAVSNSTLAAGYLKFWNSEWHMPAPGLHLPHTMLHLVNDGLMAVFFFLAGMEIKRELLTGELASLKKALLPMIAALGGMIVPALGYWLWCGNTPYSNGWGIPMATDIAFSLGVLSLLGSRAPLSLRVFLTALAIVDDLGGILTIAIFYVAEVQWSYLLLAAGILFLLILMNLFRFRPQVVYVLFGVFLWYFVYNSGVHATIAGVLLAFTIPLHRIEKLEHLLHDPVSFFIMPAFALANTAIVIPDALGTVFSSVVHHGILTGLVIGKPVGIVLFSLAAVKTGLGSLPDGLNWKKFTGMGMIAGIGFTISIFISTLAFTDPNVQVIAKVAVMLASLISAVAGFLILRLVSR